MRYKSILLLFIVQVIVSITLFSSSIEEEYQTNFGSIAPPALHVIYILDVNDWRLNRINKAIGSELQVVITNIQKALGTRVRKHYISNRTFNSEDCYSILNELPIKPLVDVVLICVVAHGEASDSEEQYPMIRFAENDKRDFGQIMDLVLVKRPAYLVSVVNTCNHFPTKKASSVEQIAFTDINNCKLKIDDFDAASLKKLFSPTKETIAITYLSSQKKTTTIIDKTGGIPFLSFINAFHHWTSIAREGPPSWTKIIFNAQAIAVCKSEREEIDMICPYGEIVSVNLDENKNIIREGQGILFCD